MLKTQIPPYQLLAKNGKRKYFLLLRSFEFQIGGNYRPKPSLNFR